MIYLILIPIIPLLIGFGIVAILFYQLSKPVPPSSDCCEDDVWETLDGEVFCLKCNKKCKLIIK